MSYTDGKLILHITHPILERTSAGAGMFITYPEKVSQELSGSGCERKLK